MSFYKVFDDKQEAFVPKNSRMYAQLYEKIRSQITDLRGTIYYGQYLMKFGWSRGAVCYS